MWIFLLGRGGERGSGTPVRHRAGDGEDGREAVEEEAVEDELAELRRQRQRGEVVAERGEGLVRGERADVLQQRDGERHGLRHGRLRGVGEEGCEGGGEARVDEARHEAELLEGAPLQLGELVVLKKTAFCGADAWGALGPPRSEGALRPGDGGGREGGAGVLVRRQCWHQARVMCSVTNIARISVRMKEMRATVRHDTSVPVSAAHARQRCDVSGCNWRWHAPERAACVLHVCSRTLHVCCLLQIAMEQAALWICARCRGGGAV